MGIVTAPFKKGPDYIDAAWLTRAGGRVCRNLDLFLMSADTVLRSVMESAAGAQVAVIEGNRGLFDGLDAVGSCSTAELAKLLEAPVLLAVDCSKATRTVAALVLGCQQMDPGVLIRGVVLNRVGSPRHEDVVRASIEQSCGIPVVGAIPRLPTALFPERHLGLVPPQESDDVQEPIGAASTAIEEYIDLEAILEIARGAPAVWVDRLRSGMTEQAQSNSEIAGQKTKIGLFQDAAFQFYYPENIEALEAAGAEIVAVSPIQDGGLPNVGALYIGGGFPETLATQLADNVPFRRCLAQAVASGLPVYAECGGAVYLGERLFYDNHEYPMVGALPVTFAFGTKPKGHGYVELEAIESNPFYSIGERLKGHEFHYTYPHAVDEGRARFAFRVRRGYGFNGLNDGICRHNVLATYTHVHALGTESWAPSLVRAAEHYKSVKESRGAVLDDTGSHAGESRSSRL